MRILPATTRAWIVAVALGAGVCVWAQDSSSLGDVARKTRKEHASSAHAGAKQVFNEEDDGPDAGGVWGIRLCTPMVPCDQLSVTLPKTPKWSRGEDQPRPALIPVPGKEDDPAHVIRVYAAEAIPPMYLLDVAKRTFLQGWFARKEYFGQAARIVRDDHIKIANAHAVITHLTVESGTLKYRGLSVVAVSAYGNYGFACIFREEDAAPAGSICDGIIQSATIKTLQPRRLTVYPEDSPQPDDPPEDPPSTDDPQ
jgi:hypothetical protein